MGRSCDGDELGATLQAREDEEERERESKLRGEHHLGGVMREITVRVAFVAVFTPKIFFDISYKSCIC
jgi:hypothetical protein